MYKIKDLKPAAYDWLLKIPAEMWSTHAFDHRVKNDHVTNNISESFNHWVGELRSKNVLALVDGLRAKLMNILQKRKQKGSKWTGLIVPNVVKILNTIKDESKKCQLSLAGDFEFEVQDQNRNYIVNLRGKTCNCMVWDISGIPCKHVALGIAHRREDVQSYIDNRFFTAKYMKAYKHLIHPIPDPSLWPQDLETTPSSILPPLIRKLPGRPKKSRRKEPGEAPNLVRRAGLVRCKVCNQQGHNRRTCPVSQNKDKNSKMDIPLTQIAKNMKKRKRDVASRKRSTS